MDVTDVKTTKANRWCLHIKDFAAKSNISYRDAMRSEACKAAYKTPEVPEAPEVVPEIGPLVDLPIPKLERTELIQPKAVKKQRQKHRTVLVPT